MCGPDRWRTVVALKDGQGNIRVPGFYDEVRQLTPREREEFARMPFDAAEYRADAFSASLLPRLSVSGTVPSYNRSIIEVLQPDGTGILREADFTPLEPGGIARGRVTRDPAISVNQNCGWRPFCPSRISEFPFFL